MRYEFRENEDVAHIDNLSMKLTVRRPKYINVKINSTGKEIRRIEGIICYWWYNNKLQENIFHSERLVPWHFARQGKEIAEQWLKDMGAKTVYDRSKD